MPNCMPHPMSTDSPDLYCLLYVSTAHLPLDDAEMEAILEVSRTNNQSAGITGLLVHNHEHFLQVLEGPVDAVQETYERIKADPRHKHVTTMVEDSIKTRFFSDWTMAYQKIADSDAALNLSLQKILIQKEPGTLKTVRKMFEIFQNHLGSSVE